MSKTKQLSLCMSLSGDRGMDKTAFGIEH